MGSDNDYIFGLAGNPTPERIPVRSTRSLHGGRNSCIPLCGLARYLELAEDLFDRVEIRRIRGQIVANAFW